jgi:RNA polymerase sigma factor (TIGR02999 family)
MSQHPPNDVVVEAATTRLSTLLDGINGGRPGAFARLIDAVYDDLKQVAAGRMGRDFDRPMASLTLSPTAVVNDAIVGLMRQQRQQRAWANADHFFAVATLLIRRVIQTYRRDRAAAKRGGGGGRGVSLDHTDAPDVADSTIGPESPDGAGGALEVLQRLHDAYPRKAEVVSLHVLCGHPLPKVAEMIGVSLPTAERDWRFAKAWLTDRLGASSGGRDDR